MNICAHCIPKPDAEAANVAVALIAPLKVTLFAKDKAIVRGHAGVGDEDSPHRGG